MPASLVALHLNLPLVTLADLAADRLGQRDTNRWGRAHFRLVRAAQAGAKLRVLVVDDTINTGAAIRRFRDTHAAAMSSGRYAFTFLAIYKAEHDAPDADLTFETVPRPARVRVESAAPPDERRLPVRPRRRDVPRRPAGEHQRRRAVQNYILNAPLKLRPAASSAPSSPRGWRSGAARPSNGWPSTTSSTTS